MLRIMLFAGVAAVLGFAATPSAQATARCQDTNFRVYFDHDSAALDAEGRAMIATAERIVAECEYAELHVAVDASSPHAAQRGRAILAASDSRSWNVRAVEAMPMTRPASYSASPEYAQVLMTPRVVPVGEPLRQARTGV